MANVIADGLSQIPMSANLAATLARAAEHAESNGRPEVTVEHLLFGLIDDADARLILMSSAIDPERLRASVGAHLEGDNAAAIAAGTGGDMTVAPELTKILSAAATAAQGRRGEINGSIVLAAIVGDGGSAAARLLRAQGLTFDAAIRALQQAPARSATVERPPQGERTTPTPRQAAPPQPQPVEQPEPQAMRPPPGVDRIEKPPGLTGELGTPQEAGDNSPPDDFFPAEPIRDDLETLQDFTDPSVLGGVAPAAMDQPAPKPTPRPGQRARIEPEFRGGGPERPAPRREPEIEADRPPPSWRAEPLPFALSAPRAMRTRKPVVVEARVPKAKVRLAQEGVAPGAEVYAAKAVSARLRGPEDAFWIEMAAPETQWIENPQGLPSDEIAGWRWIVTPKKRGRARLQLLSSVRIVEPQGHVTQIALPDQGLDVRTAADYGRAFRTLLAWGMAALVGGLLVTFQDSLWEAAIQIAPKLTRLLNP